MVFRFVFFLRDVFNSITHMNRVPTMCLPLSQAHSISVSLFILRFVFFFFYKTPSFPRSLASKEWIWGTMSHSQREMAVSTGQREHHSGTQLVGFAADTVSNLGHHSWRIKWKNTRGILSLHFLCPHFPWSNLLLHRGRGTGSGQWGLPVLTSSSKCHW